MPNVLELETINKTEADFYENLPSRKKTEIRQMFCERMGISERTFSYRLKKVSFSELEKQVFKEFASKHNTQLYPKNNQPDTSETGE